MKTDKSVLVRATRNKLADLAFDIHSQVKLVIEDTSKNFYRLGLLMKRIRDEKLWEVMGYHSFEAYFADPELGLAKSSVYHSISLVETFPNFKEIEKIEYTKLIRILPYVTETNKEKLLTASRTLSRSDLIKEIEEITGQEVSTKRLPSLSWCLVCNKIRGITPEELCEDGHEGTD